MKQVNTFLLFILLSVTGAYAQNPDIDLLRKINVDRNVKLEPGFLFITRSVTPISLGSPAIQLGYGIIKKDNTAINNGILAGSSFLLASTVSTSLKYIVNRDRPFTTYPDIQKRARADLPSFPSGHTTSAFATATTLSLAYPKWYVIVPTYAWAGVVGYSRMYLGVHYPSDVLVGAIIGTGSALVCYKTMKVMHWM